MKTLTIILLLLFTGYGHSLETVTLTETNHVSLIGTVSDESIEEIIYKIEKLQSPIYLFIDSPGGSVLAGVTLINYIETSDKIITCVAKTAVSMAHQIMQHCPVRLATPTNIMMQHRMSAAVDGPLPSMQGLLSVLVELEKMMNITSSTRIGIPVQEFSNKVTEEWWTFGKQSKELNIVDNIVNVKCDSKLYATNTKKTVVTLFGPVSVIENGCPLMAVRIDKDAKNLNPKAVEEVLKSYSYVNL